MNGSTQLLSLIVFLSALLSGCQDTATDDKNRGTVVTGGERYFANAPAGLDDYWYQGKAEISTYELSQNRYRDVHPGTAVLIFVTEDFLVNEQVKDERGTEASATTVLKTNRVQQFTTGLYEYSIMTSVFTPVEVQSHPNTLKVSTSAQDWCGHAWMQLNRRKRHYRMQLFSYFESEGDREKKVPLAPLEDELFNRIRINPASLPTGKFNLLPGTMYCRLMHVPFEPVAATATLEDYRGDHFAGAALRAYRVEYPTLKRSLSIVFESAAPYRIAGWIDTYPSSFDGAVRQTVAKRKATMLDPYWQHNSRADSVLRQALELRAR